MGGSFTMPHLNAYVDTHILIMDCNLLNSISHWLYGIKEPEFMEMTVSHHRHREVVNNLLSSIGIRYSHDYIDGGHFITYEFLIRLYKRRNTLSPQFESDLSKLLKSKCYVWNPRRVDFYLMRSLTVPWNVVFESLVCRLSKLNSEQLNEIGESDTIDRLVDQEGMTLCECLTPDSSKTILKGLIANIKRSFS